MCCGLKEDKSSSMNYAVYEFIEFPDSLFEMNTFQRLLGQTNQLLDAEKINNKFEGRIIISPKCLASFLSMMLDHLGSGKVVAKTSRFLDKIDQKVLSTKLNINSRPQSFANPVHYTDDGYITEDIKIIENGILKTYLLDLFGCKKNGIKKNQVILVND